MVMGLGGESAIWGEVNRVAQSKARNEVNELFEGLRGTKLLGFLKI